MPTGHTRTVDGPLKPNLAASILFAVTLLAFVAESQLTQYVQSTLGFEQPFLLFYVVHSSFIILFPLHLLYLVITTGTPARTFMSALSITITAHLVPSKPEMSSFPGAFPVWRMLRLVLWLTAGITVPGLLWFASVSLSSLSDLTAIWNCNAFFAYVITVRLDKLQWEARPVLAVIIASVGVLIVVYGGSAPAASSTSPQQGGLPVTPNTESTYAPLIGDGMTLIASFGYGLYQVLYKKYAALPSDPEVRETHASSYLTHSIVYERLPNPSDHTTDRNAPLSDVLDSDDPLPFGLYSNLFTSAMGLCTFVILWIFVPILHYIAIEPFKPPSDHTTVFAICGIAASGIIFNAGLMILLGTWGPIIVSVGNLLTIVLVLISDIVFAGAIEKLTVWSLLGCGMIVGAFGVLVYDMQR